MSTTKRSLMVSAWFMAMFLAVASQTPMASAQEPSVTPMSCCRYIPPRDPQVEPCFVGQYLGWVNDWFKPMPQTCYSPTFGCYPGNGRDIQRYPAFHGNYYRRAYNYRHLSQWPWEAELHEPVGYCPTACRGPLALPMVPQSLPPIAEPIPKGEPIAIP